MDGQALISQKEYSTVKTMYVLAVFFCVVTFLLPLGDICSVSAAYLDSHQAIPLLEMLAGFASILLSCWSTLLLLFVFLLAKGRARKTVILAGFILLAAHVVITLAMNYINVYLSADPYSASTGMSDAANSAFTKNSIFLFIRLAVYVVFAVFLFNRMRGSEIKPASKNPLFVLLAVLASLFIYNRLLSALLIIAKDPEGSAFAPWALFIASIVLICLFVYWHARPLQIKYAALIRAALALLLLVFMAIIYCGFYSYESDTAINILYVITSFLFSLIPLYFMYMAYKAVSQDAFYINFVVSHPKVAIHAKQYEPAEDSVWNQFVTILRKAFLKTQD